MKAKILSFALLLVIAACEKEENMPYSPLNERTTAQFNPMKNYGMVTDIDGNIYKTIIIGDQEWMAENLRVTRYQNGDSLVHTRITPTSRDFGDTNYLDEFDCGAYCSYNDTENLDTIATYGLLYNGYAALDERNIAPKGWRVPNNNDWKKLLNYLSDHGSDSIASLKLKEKGNLHWEDNIDSPFLNISGFTALPSKLSQVEQMSYGESAIFWSTTKANGRLVTFNIYNSNRTCIELSADISGYNIRCIKNKKQ